MPFEIVTVPCLSDNYAYIVHAGGRTAVVDAPEAAPIAQAVQERGWTIDEIWITHHHNDHIDGVDALRAGAIVRGAAADTHRLPTLDAELRDGDSFDFSGHEVQILDVSGHTIGHIAFHIPDAKAAFTADSLMALGCGRVFEGTFEQMWESLPSRRYAHLLGARIYRVKRPFRADHRAGQSRPAATHRGHQVRPRRWQAHRPFPAGRGTGHQPVPPRGVGRGEIAPKYE